MNVRNTTMDAMLCAMMRFSKICNAMLLTHFGTLYETRTIRARAINKILIDRFIYGKFMAMYIIARMNTTYSLSNFLKCNLTPKELKYCNCWKRVKNLHFWIRVTNFHFFFREIYFKGKKSPFLSAWLLCHL